MRIAAATLLLILAANVAAQESPADLVAAAKVHYEARRYKEARATYEKARTAAEAAGDSLNLAHAKLGLAALKTMYGEFEEGIVLASEALATFEAGGDKPGQADALHHIGNLYMGNSKFGKAVESFRRCASLADGARKAGCLQRVGDCEVGLGQYRQAMATLREAVAAAIASNNRVAHASALGTIGDVHIDQGNVELAVYYHEKSLAMFRELGNTIMVSVRLNNLAISYHVMGRHDRALETYRENLALMERLGYTRGILISKMNMAAVLLYLRRDDEGARMLNELLPMLEGVDDPDSRSHVLQHLAVVAERRGDLSGALEHALNAQSEHTEDITNRYRSHTRVGHLYRKLGRFAEARTALTAAIDSVESMHEQASGEEVHFFDERSDPYVEMATLAIDEGRVEESLGYADRYRSRVLVGVLRADPAGRSLELTDEERNRERELLDRLTELQRAAWAGTSPKPDDDQKDALTDARREYDAFQHELADAHPRLHVARGTLQQLAANEIVSRVPTEAALVEYLVTDEKTYAFVISGGTITVRTIDVDRDTLVREAESFRILLADRRPDFRKSARSLHETLIAPIADLLSRRHSWILVPDGPLWNLPFQALLDSRGTYVAERAAIVYAPSIAAWMEMSRNPHAATTGARRELLAFGNPTTPSAEGVESVRGALAPLPEAETEVKSAARFYGTESAVYVRDEATEERFKAEAPRYRVLHVAGHGVLNDASPMHSYLLLASGDAKKEDGYLEVGELMHMDLGAELVVLSACDTARGKYAAGEGIIGFSWALFAARCRTQVLSQWRVNSAATSVLMRNFHRNVRGDRTKAASALQKTIVSMLKTKQYRHPFYWAGFVVLGDAL